MSDEKQNPERNFRARIASFIQADQPSRCKQLTEEEAQTLKAASGRLARSPQLKQEEVRALTDAAGRLDRLLRTSRPEKGKDS